MKPIIEISNLGKEYPIVHDKVPYSTLRDSVMNFIKHPFARRQTHESFWALKDINLTINRGEIVGIIGKNGAGKSTLLKILSGITKPTEGKVKLYGRVSSLLEVGTGFHPELTGRENIFLNGVILGMTRKEVAKKFSEIVAFAGIEKFLDTPVKHYSSGMYVRLAFSIAAHLEPDILIVDEVLAVGDAEFQKKCLGKMGEISKEDGRTVIFVSHNMGAINRLCGETVLIDAGKIIYLGNTNLAIDMHINGSQKAHKDTNTYRDRPSVTEVRIEDINGNQVSHVTNKENYFLTVEINVPFEDTGIIFGFVIFNEDNLGIFTSLSSDSGTYLHKGVQKMKIQIPTNFMNTRTYRVEGSIMNTKGGCYEQNDNYLTFECMRDHEFDFSKMQGLRIPYKWEIVRGSTS